MSPTRQRTPTGQKALIAAVAALVTAIATDITIRQSSRPASAPTAPSAPTVRDQDAASAVLEQLRLQSSKIDELSRQVADTNVVLGRYDERLKQIERRLP